MKKRRKRILLSFDPIIDIDSVVLNGRYIFAYRFLKYLLKHSDIDQVIVLGDVEGNRVNAEKCGISDYIDRRLILKALECVPGLFEKEPILAIHSSMDKRLLWPMAVMREWTSKHISPLTVTTHGVAYFEYMPHFTTMMVSGLHPYDAIICPSPSVKHSLEVIMGHIHSGIYPGEAVNLLPLRLEVIPNGIDTELFHPRPKKKARKSLKLPEDQEILLFVGRLNPATKIDFWPVLRTLAPLWSENRALILCIVTPFKTNYSQALEQYARSLGIDIRIVYNIGDEELARYYNAADIFLGMSDTVNEVFGLTLLEAMASGLPVIATEVGGYRDLVIHEKTGLRVRTYISDCLDPLSSLACFRDDIETLLRVSGNVAIDPKDLLEGCERLLKDRDLRKQLAHSAREMVLSEFGWPSVIERYVSLWDRLYAASCEPQHKSPAKRSSGVLPFFKAFSPHFSAVLDEGTLFSPLMEPEQFRSEFYTATYPAIRNLFRMEIIEWFLSREGPWTLKDLLEDDTCPVKPFPGEMGTCVMWALKQGIIRKAK